MWEVGVVLGGRGTVSDRDLASKGVHLEAKGKNYGVR